MKKVRDYLYKDIVSVNETSTLRRVVCIMRLHRINAVSVVNKKGEYVGCISAQQIIDASVPDYIKSIYNTSFMSRIDQISINLQHKLEERIDKLIDKKYPIIAPGDSISYAANLLIKNKKTILPVVENKIFMGWVTKIDILSVLCEGRIINDS